MTVLIPLACFAGGVAAGWWFTLARAGAALSRARAGMAHEVRQWQEAAERAAAEAARIAREAESWRAGWHQGRDDVMSLGPLLVAAHERVPGVSRPAVSSDDHS